MLMSFRNGIEQPMLCFSLIIFMFFTIPVTSYNPTDMISINCGSSKNSYTSLDNRSWQPDDDSKVVSLGQNNRTSIPSEATHVSPPLEEVPYATARLSHYEFTYSFNVTYGQKFVRLFFYPSSYSNLHRSNALFTVKAGHHTLLKDFNASLTADNDDDAEEKVFKEYCINVEPGHMLNITFTPSTNHPDAYAFINGIEVVSMPADLYFRKPHDPSLKSVQESNLIQVDNKSALEMVYRINVGGGEIPAAQDTGMFREWHDLSDYGFHVIGNLQDLEYDFDETLTYPNDLLKDAAPEEVSLTAKTSKDIMDWEFKVDPMFAYMIRLHFLELDQVVQKGERFFQVLIEDTLVEPANKSLPWKQRLEICIGAAKAFCYLHTQHGGNTQSLIHCNVKSSNILLGHDWVAKVSDFELSKIGPNGVSMSHVTTDAKGTCGYIDPEYDMTLNLTQRSDVYSFGAVLLEVLVLCGRPHILQNMENELGFLVDWVKKCYQKGEIDEVVDPFLKGTVTPQCLNKFVEIALSCLRKNGWLRPSMRDVVIDLETML